MNARSIALNENNKFISVDGVIPQAKGFDLLVEVKASALNPVDTKLRARLIKDGFKGHRILGFDASGIVIDVGLEVEGFKVGDRVMYAGDINRAGSNSTHQLVDHRIAAHAPLNISLIESAALPLTSLVAYESLFDRLRVLDGADLEATEEKTQQEMGESKSILIIGGAGGVGSIAIPLARLSKLKVIATASSAESKNWCIDRGAHMVVDYRNLKEELSKNEVAQVDFILCLNNTDAHWENMCELVAPQGHICNIVDNLQPLSQALIKTKSVALHWESMFTRSTYNTPDISRQGQILQKIADLIDKGKLKGSLQQTLKGLSVENINEGHKIIMAGHTKGKIVIDHEAP